MFEILFIDLDDTILDFKMQEDAAITKTLRAAGIDPTPEICDRYSRINKEHWKRMEKGEIDRNQVLYGRFEVQNKRLDSAGIRKYFEAIFISQDIGINKPDKGFFDYCFARIPGFDPKKTMIVGDSPSSDMLGGQNAGIATCWVNPTGRKYSLEQLPDYEIQSLAQLENLLNTL